MTYTELGHELRPLEEALDLILSHTPVLESERVPLDRATGRALREDLIARDPIPPFAASAMDGYAVRSEDLRAAGPDSPVRLELAGSLKAGDAPSSPVLPGTAVRIMTGAPVPPGADAVVPHELTRLEDRGGRPVVVFTHSVAPGRNVRPQGGDVQAGGVPLRAGVLLRAPQVALAGALGYARIAVARRPRVAVLSPGDELVDVAERPPAGSIRNSNAFSLAALLALNGAEPLPLGIIRDSKEAIREAVFEALDRGADAVLSSGGVSAGDFDFVRAVVEEHARPGYVLKVAMRPGKPQAFGLFDGRPFFGLPGNPAAAIVSFEVLVRPALRRMLGLERVHAETFGVRFPFEYRYKGGRRFFLRARLEPDPGPPGGYRVAPPGPQDSSFLASLAHSNALVILPEDEDRVPEGGVRPAQWMSGFP